MVLSMKFIVFAIYCGFIYHPTDGVGDWSIERDLYTDLFSNYNRKLRPIKGTNFFQKIRVHVEFAISQVESLNEKEEYMVSHGGIRFSWTDQLLQWNESDYNGATFLVLPAEDIWLPELTPINSVVDISDLAFEKDNSRVRILSDGSVSWIPNMSFRTSCTVNITVFPYDEQTCLIRFANWMYTTMAINFTVDSEVDREIVHNGTWSLTGTRAWVENNYYDGYLFQFVTMELKIKRNPRYFELNVIMPGVLLSLLLVPMFLLPVDSGEKISLGVTLMLAYSIFLLMLSEYTPQSGPVPNITLALLISTMFAGTGLLCNVIIINIHHHRPNKKLPRWVRKVFLEKLACCLCMSQKEKVQPLKVVPQINKGTIGKANDSIGKDFSDDHWKTVVEYLEHLKTKQQDEEQIENNKDECNRLARILDRLFFWLYLTYFIMFFFVVMSVKWGST